MDTEHVETVLLVTLAVVVVVFQWLEAGKKMEQMEKLRGEKREVRKSVW